VEKQRFNCLHSVDPEKVCTIIMACAVHHNIAVNLRDSLEDVPDTDMDEDKHELASSMCELLENFERKSTHMTYKPPFCISLTKEVWAK
jgi:hypothetical protein